MNKSVAMLAISALLATACASDPAPSPSGGAAVMGAPPATRTAAGTAIIANLAASTRWIAEERLMPEDPVLALVSLGGSDPDASQGAVLRCNPANGRISMRLGRQPAARVGQTATFRMRTGASLRDVEGKFEANRKAGDADFVFPLAAADLMGMSNLDMVSFLGDQGEVEWAFVKDPAASVQARYIASMKDLGKSSRDFLTFCNPK